MVYNSRSDFMIIIGTVAKQGTGKQGTTGSTVWEFCGLCCTPQTGKGLKFGATPFRYSGMDD